MELKQNRWYDFPLTSISLKKFKSGRVSIILNELDKVIRIDGNICFIARTYRRKTDNILCSTDKLQFAHLRPTVLNGMSRGSYERYKDIISNPDCYILLCKKHHQMFDNGELKL